MFITDANLHGFADDHTLSAAAKTLDDLKRVFVMNRNWP